MREQLNLSYISGLRANPSFKTKGVRKTYHPSFYSEPANTFYLATACLSLSASLRFNIFYATFTHPGFTTPEKAPKPVNFGLEFTYDKNHSTLAIYHPNDSCLKRKFSIFAVEISANQHCSHYQTCNGFSRCLKRRSPLLLSAAPPRPLSKCPSGYIITACLRAK